MLSLVPNTMVEHGAQPRRTDLSTCHDLAALPRAERHARSRLTEPHHTNRRRMGKRRRNAERSQRTTATMNGWWIVPMLGLGFMCWAAVLVRWMM